MSWLLALLLSMAPTSTYHLVGDRALPLNGERSCGASSRLLADQYRVELWPDRAAINGTPWAIVFAWSGGGVILGHASQPDSITRVSMTIEPSKPGDKVSAELTLVGADEARRPCFDRVRLVGYHLR